MKMAVRYVLIPHRIRNSQERQKSFEIMNTLIIHHDMRKTLQSTSGFALVNNSDRAMGRFARNGTTHVVFSRTCPLIPR